MLFAVVLPVSLVAGWAVSTVTDTSRWVETLQPLASNRTVISYIANEGAVTIVKDFKVEQRIAQALPHAAAFLAPTITADLEGTIATAIKTALHTKTFVTLWNKENRLTHSAAVALLTYDSKSTIHRARSVILDVTPTILSAIKTLDSQGITVLDSLRHQILSGKVLVLHLLDRRELREAHNYFQLATSLQWALPALVLLAALLVLFTSRPRQRGFRRLCVATLLSSAVTFAALRITISVTAPLAPTPVKVTTAILDDVSRVLALELKILLLVGALGLVADWFMGAEGHARTLRQLLRHAVNALLGQVTERSREFVGSDWQQWSDANQARLLDYLRFSDVVVGTAIVTLVLFWSRSIGSIVVLLALGALWLWASRRARQRISEDQASSSASELDATKPQ